ncbi:MAG: F0F1 ATP synthase subunit delta [Sinomicrobium sp.]|nr:F0F1 ATP synthase subunit delta [Sinomicrobium sp.]
MQINWFTVVAQIINFMVLVWLMKRFLYRPVLNAVEEREKKIKSELEDAAQKEKAAAQEKEDYHNKNAALDAKKSELMDQAVADSEAERKKLLEQARLEALAFKEKMQKRIVESQEHLQENFERKISKGVLSITAKTLSDLASADLEEQIVKSFIDKLGRLKEEELAELKDLIRTDQAKTIVQSAFELRQPLQDEISNALEQISGKNPDIRFVTNTQLIGGVEIACEGFKLSWSIREYIQSLEKETGNFVQQNLTSK